MGGQQPVPSLQYLPHFKHPKVSRPAENSWENSLMFWKVEINNKWCLDLTNYIRIWSLCPLSVWTLREFVSDEITINLQLTGKFRFIYQFHATHNPLMGPTETLSRLFTHNKKHIYYILFLIYRWLLSKYLHVCLIYIMCYLVLPFERDLNMSIQICCNTSRK